ncbi:hypothetical protein H2203_008370 [Taxawa tesnikishii (nom. ined.)]|nr:hypothetical protein H2203_008370 [Dothideales sp. JES 119]
MPSGNYHRFRQDHELIESTAGPYWELNYPSIKNQDIVTILRRNGYTGIRSSTVRPDLIDALKKVERGQPLYRNCGVKKLRKFLKARKIPYDKNSENKEYLVMRLEQADDNIRFDGRLLMKLPLEVRMQIYRFCMRTYEGVKGAIELPVQPAVTRVNREIRNEALDIFYGEHRFAIFCNRHIKDAQMGDLTIVQRLHSTTRMFLEFTENANLARIKHFEFRFTGARVGSPGDYGYWLATYHIDLYPKAACEALACRFTPLLRPVPQLAGGNYEHINRLNMFNFAIVKAGGQLREVLEALASNVGAGHFGRSELVAMAKALKERMDSTNAAGSELRKFFIL